MSEVDRAALAAPRPLELVAHPHASERGSVNYRALHAWPRKARASLAAAILASN
jgi:alpha/beta superfamily hydrolase